MRGEITVGDPVIESGMSDLDYHTPESPYADDGTCEQCSRLGAHDAKCPVRLMILRNRAERRKAA